MTTLHPTHSAIVNGHTMYKKNLYDATDYKHDVIKKSTNVKLGKKILKGIWKDHPMYTVTLEARATCTDECEHYLDCYDNNMPFAHRFKANQALIDKMAIELDKLDKKHPLGYVVRLHILGDFYSVAYVKWWKKQLQTRPNLKIYGYSRNHVSSKYAKVRSIAKEIVKVRLQFADRFKIRFSNLPSDTLSANSEHVSTQGFTCPQQTGKTASCGTCGLCWTSTKPVIFLDH